MPVEGLWPQVDGGYRYLWVGRLGEVTVDEDEDGSWSGFVRSGNFADNKAAVRRAIACCQMTEVE